MHRVVRLFHVLVLCCWLGAALAAFVPVLAQADPAQDKAAVLALVTKMEEAVIRQDRTAYLSYVDLSDPIFASEHTYWANDWATGDPLDRFEMKASRIEIDGDTATALLDITWVVTPDSGERRAEFPVRFVRGGDQGWRYAGEAWITFTADHFRVYTFPAREPVAEKMTAELPEIYEHVTGSLDYAPQSTIQIKLYDSQDTLGATIALRLPPINGWNEPGESLKLFVEPGTLPAPNVLAHELTHFAMFDMAGTTHGNYPWWLTEGVAEEISSTYWPPEQRAGTVQRVRDWAAAGKLVDWRAISDYETTPVELWGFVYPQGYVFSVYVTGTYGEKARNAWLRDMAGPMAIEEATRDTFGISFDQLDQNFHVWLAE